MHIWVDADACPKPIRQILFRAAARTKNQMTLVSNQYLKIPSSRFIHAIQVQGGFDIADEHIDQHAVEGDLVITADIPLSAKIINKGAIVLSPRGNLITHDNINEILTIRNFKEELRSTGIDTGGQSPMNNRDREIFANHLDSILNRKLKNKSSK